MCLYLNENSEERVKKVKVAKKDIFAYKVLVRSIWGAHNGLYWGHKWESGENISSRTSVKIFEGEKRAGYIYEGFHCCTTLKGAKKVSEENLGDNRVYKVKIHSKDLVAYGTWNGESCLVCKKMFIDLDKPVCIKDQYKVGGSHE